MQLLREALDRTLLLMRDEVQASDQELLSALTSTTICLVADTETLRSHSAVCAFSTAAMLLARSGHRVHLIAPDVVVNFPQPPLRCGSLLSSLLNANGDLVPVDCFSTTIPEQRVDLAVRFGRSTIPLDAEFELTASSDEWMAQLSDSQIAAPWSETSWPIGGLGAAAMIGAEAFKCSMRKLRHLSLRPSTFELFMRPCAHVQLKIAPANAWKAQSLGTFDFVSGGAIANCALYVLARIPGVNGSCRVIEPDVGDITNLNRYALLRFSDLPCLKSEKLSALDLGKLTVTSVPLRFTAKSKIALAAHTLIGTDDILARWEVQGAGSPWIGIGATTHWSAMASFHTPNLPCARCLHPVDDPGNGRIPTAAFVSFYSGLFLAALFVRSVAQELIPQHEQQAYVTSLRPEAVWRAPVGYHSKCPAHGAMAKIPEYSLYDSL